MPESCRYARLSGFYFCYFASVGIILPYWSLYLEHVGLRPSQIGALIATSLFTKLVAPYVWGHIGDRCGRRMQIVRLVCLAAVVLYAGVFIDQGFYWLLLVIAAFSFFWNAALPQFEAVTMNQLGANRHRYAVVRLWGSVGFVIASLVVGPIFEIWGVDLVPLLIWLTLIAILVASLTVPSVATTRSHSEAPSILAILRRREVLALLAVCFLIQASHGPYYGFFSIYLEDHGVSRSGIGGLWTLGVIAEIGVFLVVHRLLPSFGARFLMLLTLALTTMRWLLIAWFVDSMILLLFAQILHAFSFGLYHAVAIHLVHGFFLGPWEGRGQALYASVSFGAGGSLGAFSSGFLWSSLGPSWTFSLAAAVAFLGLVICWGGLRLRHTQTLLGT